MTSGFVSPSTPQPRWWPNWRRCGRALATSPATPSGLRCGSWDGARSSWTASSAAPASSSPPLVTARAPGLLALYGIGPHTAALLLIAAGDHPGRLRSEASWAHLCAVAPLPASSGKTVRHRLNPGGDRSANHALWRIVFTRMGSDPATRAYAERRTSEGKSKAEILRCLKRYVAREACPHLRTSAG
jgi:hypothetical protein